MKNRRIMIGIVALVTVLLIFGVIFFFLLPQRNPQLFGAWGQFDGKYTLIFYADGSGSIEPDVPSITWRTRGGQLILTSLGVDIYYEYTISDDVKLVITRYLYDGRQFSRMYVRMSE